MAYKIVLSDEAAEIFDELDKSVKNQIQKFFDRPTFKTNPKEFGKPLSYDLHGLWRYRVGDWRIISKIKEMF